MQQFEKHKQLFVTDEENKSEIDLSLGNSLIVDKTNSEITLLNNNKELQLYIKITSEGLIVNLNALKLNIHANNELNLTSEQINIEATKQLNLKSKGNLVQEIYKDALAEVGGTNKSLAKVQKITASLGNIELRANDDVKLDGESVKLNCEEPGYGSY